MGNQNKTLDDIFQEPKQHAMLRKGGTALVLLIIGITLLIVGSNGGFQEKLYLEGVPISEIQQGNGIKKNTYLIKTSSGAAVVEALMPGNGLHFEGVVVDKGTVELYGANGVPKEYPFYKQVLAKN